MKTTIRIIYLSRIATRHVLIEKVRRHRTRAELIRHATKQVLAGKHIRIGVAIEVYEGHRFIGRHGRVEVIQ